MLNFRLFGALCGLLFVGACSTDVILEGPYQDIPIVYSYLSITDTAHYVRVEKAFLEPGGDAFDIARRPDSLYYGPEEASVVLEIARTGQRFPMSRVDGAAEGYPRQEGIFATTPNILYKLPAATANLRGGDQVRVYVERPKATEPAIAETMILSAVELRSPRTDQSLRFSNYRQTNSIVFRVGNEAAVFDIRMIIHYRESLPGNPSSFVEKSVEWVLNDAFVRDLDGQLLAFNFLNEEFYQFLANNLEPTADRLRLFDRLDIQVTAAGEEIAEYLRIAGANIGITSSQQLPVYTNVENGYGIVSSRYTVRANGFQLDPASRDSLRNGVYTESLNFQ